MSTIFDDEAARFESRMLNVPGKECRLCEFSRGFCITRYASSISYPEFLYICAKSEICPSFITKESVNNA